ncbi:hypothetical protein DLREEDagrD3_28090 [Denitratisoma sp. agr-D3]
MRLPLLRALAASLVLHAWLLMPEPDFFAATWRRAGSAPLRATLVALSSSQPSQLPLPATTLPRPVTTPSADRPSTNVPTLARAAPERRGNGAPGAEPSSSDAVLDAEGMRGYRMALAVQARPFWRYPPAAAQAGWQGTAELRVAVLTQGAVRVSLERSSGHAALDEAALAMMDQGARRAVLPESLQGKAFSLVLPVSFSLAP